MSDNDLMKEPRSRFHIMLFGSILIIGLLATLALILLSVPLSSIYTTVTVPDKNIPAYHLLETSDLTGRAVLTILKPDHTIENISEATGRYTLVPLSENDPIIEDMLSERDTDPVNDTVRVDILVPNTLVNRSMPGKGDIVDIYLLSDPANRSQCVFKATILDLQKITGQDGLEQNLLVIALPRERLSEYINSSFYTKVKVVKSNP